MKRIVVPQVAEHPSVPFYLAIEEWVARNLPADEYFFAWQVGPTVICGRHQVIPLEVDMLFAEANNIDVCRRKSGGGAVYADYNNVMFSYITESDAVQTSFTRYTSKICAMLGSLGITAEPTGRNDISIGGKKVAGNAFLKSPGRSIVHGTMLYDADFQTMSRVLTPSRAKRESKGVVSVPSRVTTLRNEGLKISCAEFITSAVEHLCLDGEYSLTEKDIREVAAIQSSYYDPDFLKPGTIHSHSAPIYIDGVGQICINYLTDSDDKIHKIEFSGDFFPLRDIEQAVAPIIIGRHKDSLENILCEIGLENYIAGLNRQKTKQLFEDIKLNCKQTS